jgi:histidinol-phosphate aminotransferase
MKTFKQHILKAYPYTGGSTREPHVVHKLSSNENPLGPSPKAIAAMRRELENVHEYQFESDAIFCEKLAENVDTHLNADQFLPANGGMELLDIICRGFLEPGTSCILSSPTFMAYKNFAELSGATVIDVPLLPESYQLNVPAILDSIDETTRLIFVANPNNPTSSIFPEKDIFALIKRLPDHVVLVYDEVYYHYVDKTDYARAADFINEGKNIIGIHSFSKAYGLAGIRLGYLFSTPAITKYLRHFRRPFMVSSMSMVAGMAALDDHFHISRSVEMVTKEKEWLYTQLEKQGIRFWPSDANFILIRPPIESAEFVRFLLSKGIMVRSTDALGAPGLIRITIGTPEMNQALVEAILSLRFCKIQ